MSETPRGLRVALVSIGVAIAGVAFAQPSSPSDQASIALGRDLAARNCGMCHALGRTDASPNRKAPPFRAMSDRIDMEQLGEGLATGILTQHPAMPEFRFKPHEVVAIVRYLRSVQEKQGV